MDQKPLGWQVSRPRVSWVHEAKLVIPDLGGMDSHSGGKDTAAVAPPSGKSPVRPALDYSAAVEGSSGCCRSGL